MLKNRAQLTFHCRNTTGKNIHMVKFGMFEAQKNCVLDYFSVTWYPISKGLKSKLSQQLKGKIKQQPTLSFAKATRSLAGVKRLIWKWSSQTIKLRGADGSQFLSTSLQFSNLPSYHGASATQQPFFLHGRISRQPDKVILQTVTQYGKSFL